jgi:replicative DNA helicase
MRRSRSDPAGANRCASNTATVAEPGERKSAVQQAMIRPILEVERRMTETMMPARMEADARRQIAIKAMEAEFRTAAKEGTDKATADAIGKAAAANIEVPPIPRLVADDVTPEAVGTLLSEQKGRLAIISAEGGIFDIIAGRYNGNVPNLDVWLKGQSGDMIRIDRKGRPPEYIPRPALTLGLMIQPEVLRTIAAQRVFRGRGLIARFLYALPPSRVGYRQIGAAPLSHDVAAAYDTHIQALARGMAEWLSDPAVLVLTGEAHAAIQVIESEIEPALRDHGALASLKDWGSKFVGAVARIAGILHLAECGAESGPTTAISADTVWKAADIGTYFKFAAIAAFQVMATDPAVADAVYLLGRIKHLGTDTVSERELHRACQSRFPKKDALVAAIDRLVEHGYLLPQSAPQQRGRGRPMSPVFTVHPSVKK